MAPKYRREVVGKRFIALKKAKAWSGSCEKSNRNSNNKGDSISDPIQKNWLAGVVRASSEADVSNNDAQASVIGVFWRL